MLTEVLEKIGMNELVEKKKGRKENEQELNAYELLGINTVLCHYTESITARFVSSHQKS